MITDFPGAGTNPNGIAAGPDGNLWFANTGSNSTNDSIGRITPAGVITTFTDAGIDRPRDIVAGPDGNLWFTNTLGDSIGRITPAGVVSTFTDATIDGPWGIAPGPDGNLWFTNTLGNSIGRITPAGVVSNFTGAGINDPRGITAGPDGTMWFVNEGNNSIAQVTVTAGPSVPGAPTGVSGVAGNTQVAVSWTAPASDGGAAITGYTVTASPGGATCAWTTGPLTCTVTGLTNGTPYTFTAVATNAAGTGPASAPSDAVTPRTVPVAPTGVSGVAGNTQVAVSWTAPASDGGAAITGYTVTASPGGATCAWTTGPLTCTVTGLTNGTRLHLHRRGHERRRNGPRFGTFGCSHASHGAGSADGRVRCRGQHAGGRVVDGTGLRRRRCHHRLHGDSLTRRSDLRLDHGTVDVHGHRADQRNALHLHRRGHERRRNGPRVGTFGCSHAPASTTGFSVRTVGPCPHPRLATPVPGGPVFDTVG